METSIQNRSIKGKPIFKIGMVLIFIAIILFVGLVAYRLITGKSLGLRSFVEHRIYMVKNLGKAVLDSPQVRSTSDDFSNIVFVHHSTGSNLVREGNVRELIQESGYSFWDHGFNQEGLFRPDGKRAGYNYNIPDDNTNPKGYYNIFNQSEFPIPINAYSGLLQHDVIVYKSCFRPTNHIRSDEQLGQYKAWYLDMRDEMDQHPEKIFIVVTPPPLNPAETDPQEAARARAFAEWMVSEEYLAGHPNIHTIDYFGLLAQNDPDLPDYNMLREEYRNGADSHPNQTANQTIGPIFAEFIIKAIEEHQENLISTEG